MKDRFPAIEKLKQIRLWIFALGGGILFAAFDRCGYMLKHYGTIWAVSENPWHRTVWMRILCRVPAYTLAVLLLFLRVMWLEERRGRKVSRERTAQQDARGRAARRWERLWGWKYWFFLMWAVYFASFLPAFLGGYPGLFAADAPNQVGWTFSGWLTAHHPLLHTGILCGIFSAMRSLGGSDNLAAAVYTVLQMAALSWVFAWISRFLKKEHAPVWLQAGAVFFLCVFPFHGMMAIYTTKDTLFAGIFALSAMELWKMCVRPEEYFGSPRRMLGGAVCFILLLLFRNNGFHTVILCAPFLLIYLRRYWKQLGILLIGVTLAYLAYNGPFLKLVGAEPGNSRETLSVVMQTLGRTYVAAGDIRPEEMDVIRPVMDEETLSLYTPDLSDSIKNYFDTEAFRENAGEFLNAWARIGLRNTKIYVDAFLNTTYAFWYPAAENEYLEFVCFDIQEGDPNYPHVHMEPVCGLFHRYYTAIGTDASFRQIPVVRELLSMGFYVWLMAFAALYALYKREYRRLIWMLPFWTYMGTNLLGPAALLRYAYPVMLAAPLLLFWMTGTTAADTDRNQPLHPQSS